MTTTTQLHELTVTEASRAIASGEVTPSEFADAFLARVAALDGEIQAFAYIDPAAVRAQAAALTEEAKAGTLRSPLHGIPVAIKDQFRVAGMPTTIGRSWNPSDPVPVLEATPVARLRAAGAVIMGTTYMPDRFGSPPTANPWNTAHTPGGSSSGSAAAVAARMAPIALGEQTGGSNLRPAAFCGLAGLKPTYGRVSRYRLYTISWSLDHPGIIARSMADIAMILPVIAGEDPLDDTSLPGAYDTDYAAPAAFTPPRVGVVRNFFLDRAEPVMLDAVDRVADRLAAAGADVRDVSLPESWRLVWPAWTIISAAERTTFHAKHAAALEAAGVEVKPDAAPFLPGTYYLQAQRIRRMLREHALAALADFDVLLTPTAPGPAPLGRGGGDNVMNLPWAAVGFPTITVPAGLSPEGLPLGVQFTAPPLAEPYLLRMGAWAESTLGPLPAPPI